MITDHKPLTTLLGHKRGIPTLAAARLQRWAVILSAYSYTIKFRGTKEHANADGLSRLPLGTRHAPSLTCNYTFASGQLQALPVTAEQIATATRQDPILSKLHMYVSQGWPSEVEEVLRPYSRRKDELTTEWVNRVIIPVRLHSKLLEDVHSGHPGIVRMKSIARSYFWWPSLDKDLEQCAQSCLDCQAVKNAPAVAPLHPWLWPAKPYQRLHLDFAGPFLGKMYLIVVDSHSKWPEVIEMTTTTSEKTIAELRKLFSAYGLPEQVVTDNGPKFTSEEFSVFMRLNGIKHIRVAPYHPSSNGAAERFVQTFKKAMKDSSNVAGGVQQRLAAFLLSYRSTPHATTKEAQCQLFLGRMVKTLFDLMRPNREKRVSNEQANQKTHHDQHSIQRELSIGQKVMVRNERPGMLWIPGEVQKQLGPVTYQVRTDSGQVWKRHIDHLRGLRNGSHSSQGHSELEDVEESDYVHINPRDALNEPTSSPTPVVDTPDESSNHTNSDQGGRYPRRTRQPPDRYEPGIGP